MTEDEMVAEAMLNPLSYLWLLFMQNDTTWYDGDILEALDKDPQGSFGTVRQTPPR